MTGLITKTARGWTGCVPPTNEDRLLAYAMALGSAYDAQDHARRASAGLLILAKLRRAWKRLDARKRKAKRKPRLPKSNVVVLRRVGERVTYPLQRN